MNKTFRFHTKLVFPQAPNIPITAFNDECCNGWYDIKYDSHDEPQTVQEI